MLEVLCSSTFSGLMIKSIVSLCLAKLLSAYMLVKLHIRIKSFVFVLDGIRTREATLLCFTDTTRRPSFEIHRLKGIKGNLYQ